MADDLNAKLSAIEQSGRARFGEADWNVSIEALKRAAPNGLSASDMAQLTGQPDPAAAIMLLGRHQLINEASEGNAESERSYQRIRQRERKAHAEYKGRVWQE
jgi:hypothetical protein